MAKAPGIVQFRDDIFQSPTVLESQGIDGSQMKFEGMVGNIRNLGKVAFAMLHLYRGRVQCVFEGDALELIKNIWEGDFVRVSGKMVSNANVHKGVEMQVHTLVKLAGPKNPAAYSFDKPLKERIDTLLDSRVVTLRNLQQRAIFKLQEGVGKAFREFCIRQGFTEIHSPKLVKGGAEGGANIFSLDYFDQKAFLAQSPQFYKQFMVPVFGRVFEIGPVFRAEEHATSRHVNEYTGLDLEMGYIESFKDVMAMETGFLQYLMNLIRTEYADEAELLKIDIPDLALGIPEVTFVEAKELLTEAKIASKADNDLSPEEERELCAIIKEQTGSDFIFVTHYPESKRPFYTKASKDLPGYTESFDLLFRGIEITSGGQRIHEYDEQVEWMRKKWLDPTNFADFLELHENGTPPHGGFGIGMERLLLKILGGDNIRETVLFPRDINRLAP